MAEDKKDSKKQVERPRPEPPKVTQGNGTEERGYMGTSPKRNIR